MPTYTYTGLEPGTEYEFTVAAYTSAYGESEKAAPVSAITDVIFQALWNTFAYTEGIFTSVWLNLEAALGELRLFWDTGWYVLESRWRTFLPISEAFSQNWSARAYWRFGLKTLWFVRGLARDEVIILWRTNRPLRHPKVTGAGARRREGASAPRLIDS